MRFQRCRSEDLEGETVVVKNAKVGEHDGTRELHPVTRLTEIHTIQAGVGHTKAPTTDHTGQGQLTEPATDGGDELTTRNRVRRYIAACEADETVTVGQIAGECDVLWPTKS